MSKFCFNCGTQLNDTDLFCPNCQAKQEQTQPVIQKNGVSKNTIIGITAIAVVVIAVIIFISSLFGSSYKDAIDNMIDVSINGEIEKIEKLAPKEYWEFYEEEYDMSVKELIEQFDQNIFDAIKETLEESYGKNVKVSYKVTEKKEADENIVDSVKDGLKENYGIAKKTVKKVLEVEVELTIKGSEDKDTEDTTFHVAKINGDWYMVSTSGTLQL